MEAKPRRMALGGSVRMAGAFCLDEIDGCATTGAGGRFTLVRGAVGRRVAMADEAQRDPG
eukprot:6404252-Prymnesium_polylepis.2